MCSEITAMGVGVGLNVSVWHANIYNGAFIKESQTQDSMLIFMECVQ